ncbi:segregation and condensation protein A [Levilactobacillus zymae]|uniref:Segregation and condensation protein A n=1 Tax=Levilactobacillus zymae TaxID=267363 RepID=A0A1Y6JWM6_9LACO|nr:segregation/condensation protein A [Levilactobacillus zymae]SMS14210.1 Segregation and condensation protein A [Levilactobacillus zymae]
MDKTTSTGQPLIQVSDFEGPLDLLLHLIKTNEMDIYDIRISTITSQYLTYLHQMQTLQLDVAGEYFVMAANLMAIKAKLLLPKPQTVDPVDDDEPDDPRTDLVTQLVEYQRYQRAAAELKDRALLRQQHFTRPAMPVPADTPLTVAPGVTVLDLQATLVRLAHRATVAQPVTQHVATEHFTIKDQMQTVLRRLTRLRHPIAFDRLFGRSPVLDEVVTTFLAVLELARQRRVALHQPSRLLPLEINAVKGGLDHDAISAD